MSKSNLNLSPRSYEKLEEELLKLKASKDLAASQAATKKLLQALKDETQAISDLGAKIRLDNAEYADRVAELQKADKALRDAAQAQLTNAERLVAAKMSKQQYMDAEGPLLKKKEEALDKIRQTLQTI